MRSSTLHGAVTRNPQPPTPAPPAAPPAPSTAPAAPPAATPAPAAPPHYGVLLPAALALVLSAALLLAQRRVDFTVNEEGFLWYGAVAAARGEVPLRDFYSYDPGRYYWAAAWMPVAGHGLLGLRLATAAFAGLGLFCGLLAARRAISNPLVLAAAGSVLTAWMLPRNKLYEPAVAMAGVLAAVALAERPDRRRHLAAGAIVGFGAFMGKNHGLYLGVAFLALILLLFLRRAGDEDPGGAAPGPRPRARELRGRLGAWMAGIGLGALPLLAMLAFVPGFPRAYLESILFYIGQGQTNFPRAVPWPWHYAYAAMPPWSAVQLGSTASCFLLTAVFFTLGVIAVAAMPGESLRRHALLVGAVVVGAVYTHHAFSRADLAHLGPTIHPMLLGLMALPAALAGGLRRAPRPAAARAAPAVGGAAAAAVTLLLAGITVATAVPAQPLYQRLTTHVMVPYTIAGESLWLRPRTVALLGWVEAQVAARIPPRAPILLAPNLPGLYTVLGRRSPVWDVYPIWPAQGKLDDRMLDELRRRRVEWAFIQNTSVDGRQELLFRNSHPEVWSYLERNFDSAAGGPPEHPAQCALWHQKTPATGRTRQGETTHE